jgi:hypothetical protein
MISTERAEAAVEYMRDHADEVGELYGRCKALDERRKVVKGEAFLACEGTVAEREARSYVAAEYRAVLEEIENAWAEWKAAEIKLKAAELTVDVWRSQFAASKRGHV